MTTQKPFDIAKQLSKRGAAGIMIALIGVIIYGEYNDFKIQENHINHNTESTNAFIQVTRETNEVIRENTKVIAELNILISNDLRR